MEEIKPQTEEVSREQREKEAQEKRSSSKQGSREAIESQPDYLEKLCAEERRLADEESRSLFENALWLKREREAQDAFRKKRAVEEKRKKEKEERESLIREEWAALQRKEREEQEMRDKQRHEKEERLQEALNVVNKLPNVGIEEPWHNPIAPDGYGPEVTPASATPTPSSATPLEDYGTERNAENCSFYLKTGACRFGDRCSRRHPRLTSSCTLMIPGMYATLGLQEQMLNERDQDVSLEYDESDVYEDFRNFFSDALPEFSKAGKIVQFKVSCNHEIHLRGNVFVQYSTEEECSKSFLMFNGRWYAQKQLSCEFCPIKKWKNAICGLYNQKRCPKGRNCNFLHVFPNPDGAFLRADRDLPPLSPPRHHPSPQISRRGSVQGGERRYSRSSRRSKSREYRPHSRSKSRERASRRSRSREGASRRSNSRGRASRRSRSRGRASQRSRSRSKSRERVSRRSCSRSRLQKSRRLRSRSESRSVSRSRVRSSSPSRSRSTSSETRHRRSTRKKERSSGSKKKKHRHKRKKKHSKSDHTHHHYQGDEEQ